MGINPNIIVLRCDEPLEESIFKKISLFCNVKPDCVIENITLPCLYEAPLMLEKSNFSSVVCRELHIDAPEPDLDRVDSRWSTAIKNREKDKVTIGLVGKYVQLHDAYLSVAEALRHAGYTLNTHSAASTGSIPRTLTEANYARRMLSQALDGIIVPGGFGGRGIEGMILAAKYAQREQCSLFRHLPRHADCGHRVCPRRCRDCRTPTRASLTSSASTRSSTSCPVRATRSTRAARCALAHIPCVIASPAPPWSAATGKSEISERHRHRYEFNNDYRDVADSDAGLTLSGLSPDGQAGRNGRAFRPAVLSSACSITPSSNPVPNKAHPLFSGFIAAALDEAKKR